MKKLFIMLLLHCGFAVSYAQNSPVHDSHAAERNVGSFSAISVTGDIDLFLTQADKESVIVSAAEARFANEIKTEVKNAELKIWYANQNKSWKGNRKLRAYVSFKVISSLKASDGCEVMVSGSVDADKLNIVISGASEFKGELQVQQLTINQSGASDAMISGKAGLLAVHATGASDMEAYKLETAKCSARASGGSDIRITVMEELTAIANGSSSIYYRGSAVVRDIKTTGAASVNKKG